MGQELSRRRFCEVVSLGIGMIGIRILQPNNPTSSTTIQVPAYSLLDDLAIAVGLQKGGEFFYIGQLPQKWYEEVNHQYLDRMILSNAVTSGPDTEGIIQKSIQAAKDSVLTSTTDFSKGAIAFLNYLEPGQADSRSDSYDSEHKTDLDVAIALRDGNGNIIRSSLAPASLHDITFILNPKYQKTIHWQVNSGSYLMYDRTEVG